MAGRDPDIWYCTGQPTAPVPVLDHLVGPAPEDDPEDGLEAPLRPTWRWLGLRDTERLEETLPDVEELWLEVLRTDKSGWAAQEVRLIEAARREAERQELNRIARIKARAKARRQNAELRSLRRRLLSSAGDPVSPPCPSCGGQCVYNGNYFCIACDWALPDTSEMPLLNPERIRHDRWFNEAYASLMEYRRNKEKT